MARSCYCLLLAVSAFLNLLPVRSSAQEAPPRFKFIREADTLAALYPYGDTVLLVGHHQYEVSIDGGKTWEVRSKDSIQHFILHDREPVIMYVSGSLKDSTFTINTSRDLGQSFQKQLLPFDMQYAFAQQGYGGAIQFDPFDPTRLNGFFGGGDFQFRSIVMIHSSDAGVSWDRIWLPLPPDGFGQQIRITHHARTPGSWMLLTEGTWHAAQQGYHITTDYGMTFTEIQDWGEFFGIGFDAEARNFHERYGSFTRGFTIADIFSDFHDTLDWMGGMFGKNAYQNNDTLSFGMRYDLGLFAQSLFVDDIKRSAFFVHYLRRDSETRKTISQKSYLFTTPDDGQSFELLWEDSAVGLYPSLDRRGAKLWVTKSLRSRDGLLVKSLWKTELVTSRIALSEKNLSAFYVYPNPSPGRFSILPQAMGEVVYEIIDPVQGIVIKTVSTMGQPVEIDLDDTPNGIYLIVSDLLGKKDAKLLRIAK